LLNLEGIINEAGGHMGNIVKVTVFLTDIADFPTVNSVYEAFFPSPYPARSAFAVAALPLGGKLEIEAIAVLD